MKAYLALSYLVTFIPFMAVSSTAAAQEPGEGSQHEASDVAKAKALQVEGLKLLDRGNATLALEKFRKAYEMVPSAKVMFNQGRAHEALEHDLQAFAAYEIFLQSPSMPPAAREDAQRRVDKLRTRIAFLAVTGPSGAELLLDGESHGKLPLEGAVAIAPGTHEMRLQREKQELHRQTLDARPGATINVNVVVQTQTIVREPSPSIALPPPPSDIQPVIPAPMPEEQHPQAWMRPAAWVVAGVAAGALVLGGIEQWRATSKNDDFNTYTQAPLTGDGRCGEGAPQAGGGQCQALLDAGDSARTVALSAFITGGVLAAGAATLFLLSPSYTSQEPSLSWLCSPNVLQPGAACSARF